MPKIADLAGQVFGQLTAISRVENTEAGRAQWLCRCACGGEKVVQAAYLNKGTTRSCGCLGLIQRRAAAQARCHEFSRSNLYRERKSWENMIARCYDPNSRSFPDYGKRGIGVCDRWRDSFPAFVEDMGRRPAGMTLDRINTAADYSPENCRWATAKEQANNRRNNRFLEYDGKRLTVAQWSDLTGVSHTCLTMRLQRGWPVHRALGLNV